MKLIVGLGNPGKQYIGTRHNIGFEAVDMLARRLGWIGARGEFEKAARANFDGLAMDGLASLASGQEKVMLLKPMTYMNLSGKSVQAAMTFYRLEPVDLMVVLDDLALPCGRLRIRSGGSSGGHNGLKDIERVLGTDQYPRLRIGIDAPPPFVPGKDYVLQPFGAEQRKALEPAIERSVAAMMTWMEKGVVAAMNAFNASEEKE
ncbi:MAG TPA: aminoacyl-tRNA hydrolase [Tepidisphaeraceae bacterium]|jgi:PTH1 family peptidyl-tRNA hydrolase|nr:aminoacyl-tRNA hydrolase [Tepidisphaeraceae bacterium]